MFQPVSKTGSSSLTGMKVPRQRLYHAPYVRHSAAAGTVSLRSGYENRSSAMKIEKMERSAGCLTRILCETKLLICAQTRLSRMSGKTFSGKLNPARKASALLRPAILKNLRADLSDIYPSQRHNTCNPFVENYSENCRCWMPLLISDQIPGARLVC